MAAAHETLVTELQVKIDGLAADLEAARQQAGLGDAAMEDLRQQHSEAMTARDLSEKASLLTVMSPLPLVF